MKLQVAILMVDVQCEEAQKAKTTVAAAERAVPDCSGTGSSVEQPSLQTRVGYAS